jgi:phosphoglycolate phosphatase
MPLKAANILFDLDGTLTDSRPGIFDAIRHALDLVDVEAPRDHELLWCVGPPLHEVFARLLPGGETATIERAVSAYVERYDSIGYRENRVYAGVPAMLATVGANRRLVLVTAKRQRIAESILELFRLRPCFEGVFGSERSGRFADKRELVHYVIESLGLERSETVIVGDRIHDIEAGRHNGIFSIGAAWGYGVAQELIGADRICESPHQVAQLLKGSTRACV